MKKTELKAYIKGIKFWVKDFEKTSNKYANYKNEKFNKFLKEDNDCYNIKDFESMFTWDFNPYRDVSKIACDEPTKSNIRECKTQINHIMTEDIENHINWLTDSSLNENELRCFTIKYYLKFYKKINKAMQNILINIIL